MRCRTQKGCHILPASVHSRGPNILDLFPQAIVPAGFWEGTGFPLSPADEYGGMTHYKLITSAFEIPPASTSQLLSARYRSADQSSRTHRRICADSVREWSTTMTTDRCECAHRAERAIAKLVQDMPPGTRGPVVIVVAHPDDEVIGAGSQLPHVREVVYLVHVTDGSPRDLGDARAAGCSSREEYHLVRRKELACALAQAGVGVERCFELGVVDQEASRELETIARRITDIVQTIGPELVLTHPYEGGHPDHDAVAFAVHAAWKLIAEAGRNPPAIAEFTSYHAGRWGLEVFEFLPGPWPVTTVRLSENDRQLKSRMIRCYRSQQRVLQQFPLDIERFRPAPDYDFLQPPHPGRLYYENFGWDLTGPQWRGLARDALESLGAGSGR